MQSAANGIFASPVTTCNRFETLKPLLWLLISGILSLASGCAVPHWRTDLGVGHPLSGRIWDVSTARFVDEETLMARLARARFVLLGEKHDNPDHHRLQAEILRGMIRSGQRPAVGFEMFNVDDAVAIAGHLSASPHDAAGLGPAVDWNQRGWPDWGLYQPIAEAALDAGLSIVPANLRPATLDRLRHGGAAALDKTFARQLQLDRPPARDALEKMAADIRSAHCGYASEPMIETMVRIQRARDARMAERMMAAARGDGTVLIAGAGHARRDYGVPTYLSSMDPGATVASLAFVEVDDAVTDPAGYARRFNSTRLPFDYVWFTPRVADHYPCESFEPELKRLKTND